MRFQHLLHHLVDVHDLLEILHLLVNPVVDEEGRLVKRELLLLLPRLQRRTSTSKLLHRSVATDVDDAHSVSRVMKRKWFPIAILPRFRSSQIRLPIRSSTRQTRSFLLRIGLTCPMKQMRKSLLQHLQLPIQRLLWPTGSVLTLPHFHEPFRKRRVYVSFPSRKKGTSLTDLLLRLWRHVVPDRKFPEFLQMSPNRDFFLAMVSSHGADLMSTLSTPSCGAISTSQLRRRFLKTRGRTSKVSSLT